MKILLVCIFKDDSEYAMIKRMLASFMPYASGLACAITGPGSKKKIAALVKKYKGDYVITSPETHPKIYTDGAFSNFAEARNVSFALADTKEGYDWYMWADADDILVSGDELIPCAKRAKDLNVDSVFFAYWYAIKLREDGTFDQTCVQIDHLRERLLRPKMFKWISRLHEVAVPKDGNYKPLHTTYPFDPKEKRFMVWAHLPQQEKVTENVSRNARILELQAQDEQYKDPRTLFYLAKTYYDMMTKETDAKALKFLDLYLNGKEKSGWAEERSNAWQYVANILAKNGKHREAIKALHNGIAEHPINLMQYLLLAKEYAEIGMWDESDFWLNQVSLRIDEPRTRTTIGNPMERRFLAASLKYNEAIRQQKIDDAINWLKIRNEVAGLKDDGMIKTLEDAKMLNESAKWVFNYAKWLKDNGHARKIPALLNSLPEELGREAFASFIANDIAEPKIWPEKSIVYYASWGAEHFEGWSPKNMEKGIGGSETAVIELARRWVKKGYDVTVFGDPRDDAGDYEGVHYRPWYEINWQDTFNVLILWRSPHLLDKPIKAKKIFMDLHDVASQLDWSEARTKKIDKVFVKSNYHRSMLPKVPIEKITVISNGINL